MNIYELKVWLEDYPDVTRTIAIGSEQTFEDLHNAILKSVNFDNSQLASFYVCNEQWEKRVEISLIDMDADDSEMIPVMSDTLLDEYIGLPGQKIIYEYDFVLMWKFLIELINIGQDSYPEKFPLVIEAEGVAPDQYETAERYPGELTEDDARYVEELQRKNAGLFANDEDGEDWEEGHDEDDPFSDFNGTDYYDKDDY